METKLVRPVGIDLGTTNSAVAMMSPEGDEIWLVADELGRKTYPSMLGWDPEAERFVSGWNAWNRRTMSPIPVSSTKRKMGSNQELQVGPHRLTPPEVSARVLEGLLAPVEDFVTETRGGPTAVGATVITVPAYFDAPQIEATRRAGDIAGLQVAGLVQEPTAAAMYYAWKHGIGDGIFLVYDLGGGTFDVSVIRCLSGEYQVLGIDGDNFLGGDDFDRRLAEHLRERLVESGYALDLDPSADADDARRHLLLTRVAQEVKEALSSTDVHYAARRDLFEDQNGDQVTIELEVSRAAFEGLVGDLVDQTIERCHEAIAAAKDRAGIEAADIDHVLMVGGSTRVPLVLKRVREAFCDGQTRAVELLQDEPDTCVALGAAIQAANLAGSRWVTDEGELTIDSRMYTNEPQMRIAGSFEPNDDVDAIESAVLFNPAGDVEAVTRASREEEDGVRFEFEDLAFPDPARYEYRLEFCDADGEPLAAFDITAVRGLDKDYRPTGGALSNPSVLAKDIHLEVVRDARVGRETLLTRGTSLPARGEFRFYTTDSSGAVVLRLFQNRFPIRTIHLTVPDDTPIGSPVDLDVEIDEAMAIVAQGEVAGQKFWAQIEPPPPRDVLQWETVEALLDDADEVQRKLWGLEAKYFRRQVEPLVNGIRETARTDPDKLRALVGRLEELMDDYRNRDTELTPGWSRFEQVMDAVKRVVYRGDGKRQLGMSTEEWRAKLDQLQAEGREAYDGREQDRWSAAFNQVQAIWESIAQDEYRFRSTDAGEQLVRLRVGLIAEVQDLKTALAGYDYSGNPETSEIQRREVDRLQAELGRRVERPLARLDVDRLTAAQAKVELDRLWEAAAAVRRGYERLPTLGLVSR